jgi:hypothetical protein
MAEKTPTLNPRRVADLSNALSAPWIHPQHLQAIVNAASSKVLTHEILTNKDELLKFVKEGYANAPDPLQAFADDFVPELSEDHPLKSYEPAPEGEFFGLKLSKNNDGTENLHNTATINGVTAEFINYRRPAGSMQDGEDLRAVNNGQLYISTKNDSSGRITVADISSENTELKGVVIDSALQKKLIEAVASKAGDNVLTLQEANDINANIIGKAQSLLAAPQNSK